MLLLLLQLLFFMLVLIVSGEPFRIIFLRRIKLFSELDFLQICILNIYVGGMFLYLIASLPLFLFSQVFVFSFTIFCFLFSIYAHSKALRNISKLDEMRSYLKKNRRAFFIYALVFAFFLFILLLHLASMSNLIFGSLFDESIHSLKVQVILENRYVPLTLEPYLPEGIIYPQAAHVVFGFACYMLNVNAPQSVFYVTILFKSLSVFGAYFLGRQLSSNKLYPLGLSFVFVFISSWPLYVVWGGNPFLVGFPLFLVNLGLLFSLIHSVERNSLGKLVFMGFLFGFNGALIVSYIETLFVLAVLVLVYVLICKREILRRIFSEFSIVFLTSLLLLSPVIYRFLAFYSYPGHNIGLPADFAGYQASRLPFTTTQALQWAFENLSPHYPLRLLSLLLIAGLALLLLKTRDHKDVKPVIVFALSIFTSATLLSFVSFFLPSDLEIISWGHQGILIAVSLNILILAFYVKLYRFCANIRFTSMIRFFKNSYPVALLTLVIFSSITAPFVYYRLFRDPQVLEGTYAMFAITRQDDYDLMMWMKANLSSSAVILVSPSEPGLFIPTISHHRIIYPYSGSAFTYSYLTLINLTRENIMNSTVYGLMQNLSISHVFVGSDAAYWWFEKQKWNPLIFLGNPNFNMTKNFGDAYLFEFNYTDPDTVFLDEFEHLNWTDYGWQTYSVGNGLSNVTIANSSDIVSEKQLEITSQAVYTVTELKHATYVVRDFYVPTNSDVSLSFYLNATAGFSGRDTFAIVISNIDRNQSIIISTQNGYYEDYSPLVELESSEGEFKFNLTGIWTQFFNSSFPETFVLEFTNWDFDGVNNSAYIDNIAVTSTAPE
jgi:hypothetical protein